MLDKEKVKKELLITMAIVAVILGALFPQEWVGSADALVLLINNVY